jgi:hypothetical protein
MAEQTLTLYPSEARVTPLTLIQVERMLPDAGEVMVHAGGRVEPSDVVARTHQTQDFRIVDLARSLGVHKSQVKRFMLKSEGDSVEAGQVIALRGGFPRRRVMAPTRGEILAVGNGRALLKVEPELIEVRAYVKGTVASVSPGRGVVIETPGALAQGAWGCGGDAFGVLRAVADKPDEPLRAKSIDVAAHGAIIVGGGWLDAAALEQAQQLQVRGLIVGSLDGELRAQAEAMPFPIILTEGFGRIPMAEPIFALLKGNHGREASINAATRVRFGLARPEILIPLPSESRLAPPPPAGAPLVVGARVRAIRPPYLGAVGVVESLPGQLQRLDSGVRMRGALVRLPGSPEAVFVPYANLELLR